MVQDTVARLESVERAFAEIAGLEDLALPPSFSPALSPSLSPREPVHKSLHSHHEETSSVVAE